MKRFAHLVTFTIMGLTLVLCTAAWSLDTPVITATAKGPNQIILTWSAVSNPGWGYRVEIQSDGDSRYSIWTELSWRNGRSYLDPWVTEAGGTNKVYSDPTTAASGWGADAQCNIYGLQYGTFYNFRVRTWGKTDDGTSVYSLYSTTAQATTTTPSVIRYVSTSGNNANDGTSVAKAWRNLNYADDAARTSPGALILVKGGNYTSDSITSGENGAAGTGRIVFQCVPGETCNITSTNTSYVVSLSHNFWVIDGINLIGVNTSTGEHITMTGSRNVITNLEVDGSNENDAWGIVILYNPAQYNLFHNVYVHQCCGTGTLANSQNYDLFVFGTAESGSTVSYNTLQYSHNAKGAHDTCYVRGPSNRILNNLFDGGWGQGFEFQTNSTVNCIAEGNEIANVATTYLTSVYKPGIQLSASSNLIRRNVVHSGDYRAGGEQDSTGIEASSSLANANSNTICSNTVVHNGGNGLTFWGTHTGNTVRNNIFFGNGLGEHDGGNEFLEDAGDIGTAQYNVFLQANASGTPTSGAAIMSWNYGSPVTLAAMESAHAAAFSSNLQSTPVFFSYSSRSWDNLHLKSTSPTINAGTTVSTALTTLWGAMTCNGPCDVGAFEHYEISGGASNFPSSPKLLRLIRTE